MIVLCDLRKVLKLGGSLTLSLPGDVSNPELRWIDRETSIAN